MENLVLSINVVLPLFLMMALGYFLKTIKFFDGQTLKKMNVSVFRVFLPILIFNNVYHSELEGVFNLKMIIFSIISIALMFLFLFLVIPLFEKDRSRCGVLVQGIFRSNFVIFGVPIAESICGDEAKGVAAVLVTIIIPVYNLLAVVVLEVFRGQKPDFKKIFLGIITNPLIISSTIGLVILFSGLKLPYSVEKTVSDLSGIATPLALVVLGGSVNFGKTKGFIKELIAGLSGKLVISPLVFMPIAVLLGFRNAELAVLLSVFASPAAVSSFTMAEQMGGDGELAGQLVAFGAAVSSLTIFIWIFILKQLGYM